MTGVQTCALPISPYNLIKEDEDTYIIELAIAGFDKNDIEVKLDRNTLYITGTHDSEDIEYEHKGIATRDFKRSFALGEFMEVIGAECKNGLLSIRIERIIPEDKKPKTIRIK